MEDPWANAWGEPSNSKSSLPAPANSPLGPSSTWAAPSVSTIHGDNEDDISTPTWSVEPTTVWDDSGTSKTSLWSTAPADSWSGLNSSYGGVTFNKFTVGEPERSPSPPPTNEVHVSPKFSFPPSNIDERPESTPYESHPSISESPPSSPDAFGTFETAADPDLDVAWTSGAQGFPLPSLSSNEWGGAWEEEGGTSPVDQTGDQPTNANDLDGAWQTAIKQKEAQDRHVPPAMLSALLNDFESVAGELWPAASYSSESESTQLSHADSEDLGLAQVVRKLVPEEMTLPANIPFTKTFVSKQLVESLKATKNSPVARFSPLSMFMASKGSTAWEVSVKSKSNANQEDFAPPGWKVVETIKEDTSPASDGKKRTGGGLLSFFGRRGTSSEVVSSKRTGSPVEASTPRTSSSPRQSVDAVKSITAPRTSSGRATPNLPVSEPLPTNNTFNSTPTPSTTSDPSKNSPNPISPPSAVSRFLGKFSSRSSRTSSETDSLALSSNDLEFLSDLSSSSSYGALGSVDDETLLPINPQPPPPKLAPPPKSVIQPQVQPQQASDFQQDQDLFSIFDSSKVTTRLDAASTSTRPLTPRPSSSKSTLPSSPQNTSVRSFTPPISNQSKISLQTDQSWPSFDYPSSIPQPFPKAKRTPVVAVMKPPSQESSALPPALPPPSLRQASSMSSTSFSGLIPILPPPPSSRSQTPSFKPPPAAATTLTGAPNTPDVDFSDFLSSPVQSNFKGPTFGSFSFVESQFPLASDNSPSLVSDDFDDFVGFSATTPPKPPEKPLNPVSNPHSRPHTPLATKATPPLPSKPAHSRTPSKKADHSRTLSLLETAAARGRWPAPPSPLPEALPPPGAPKEDSSLSSFFGTMQAQQGQAFASLQQANLLSSRPPSSIVATGPSKGASFGVSATTLIPSPLGQLPPPTSWSAKPSATVPDIKTQTTGGLSAQDLSFFEGL